MNLKTSKLLISLAISAALAPYHVFAVDNPKMIRLQLQAIGLKILKMVRWYLITQVLER